VEAIDLENKIFIVLDIVLMALFIDLLDKELQYTKIYLSEGLIALASRDKMILLERIAKIV
jgi:hypothetical protein